jgi:acyl carrier protein
MVMPIHEITAVVRDVLRDPALELTPATRFGDLAGWEDMDLVSVIAEAECRFAVQFTLPEIDRVVTVADLQRMIAAKQAREAA